MRIAVIALLATACGSSAGGADGHPAGSADAPPVDAGALIDAPTVMPATLRFAIVGDTRPANEDDVAHYPTAIITAIWDGIEALSPRPDFAISTGDYLFASPSKTGTASTVKGQLDLYLAARAHYTNPVYPALGNHECTGATASNCGAGNADGITPNYTAFLTRMLAPLGVTKPYYSITLTAADGAWTAKLVFIAANAWDSAQAAWLEQALTPATTYTFVVRHEDAGADTAPGVTPSEAILRTHAVTLKIVGHTHTYAHYASEHEVVCGNGGAPLTSGTNYGFAVIERQASGDLAFTEYDYQSHAVLDSFRIHADGTAAP